MMGEPCQERVFVIGGGGREHALCLGLSQSNLIAQIHCTPGNAGIAGCC